MKSQTILLAISLVTIGVFVMPSTVSLFTGQHTFYNGSSVKCEKCHADIYQELIQSTNNPHYNPNWTEKQVFDCEECHNASINLTYYYQSYQIEKPKAHAATTVPCLACHGDVDPRPFHDDYGDDYFESGLWLEYGMACEDCHIGGGYWGNPPHFVIGSTLKCSSCDHSSMLQNASVWRERCFIKLVNRSITGSEAAHREYFYQASYPDNQSEIKLKDSNTACIGCHTHTTINITWKRHVGYDMGINHSSGEYNITYVKNNTMTTTYSGGE